jgi:hypothetical protein
MRQPLGVVRRHHAVQLSGDGPDVDVRGGDRLRQHLRAASPRERDPSCLAVDSRELLIEAGLPPGVFNVVSGDKVAVDALLDASRASRRVSFVGSTPIASYIYARPGARSGKRVQALGGAKNQMMVDARRRHRSGGRCADRRCAMVRPASAAWRSRWRWRSVRWPTRWS